MSETLLELQNVSVDFGDFRAVDNLTFKLDGGELLGMIGPNGAGKTTALRAAAGLQAVANGNVRIQGTDLNPTETMARASLGFTPDTPPVYDNITVSQFLGFIGDCYGMDRKLQSERIDYWLEQLWLQDKRDSEIKALSRGMRQRLAVARTLLPDPHIVLLDEPAAGLDPAGRLQFRQLLASLRDQGKAIIVSSHILADLADYCTHILIMEHGRALRFSTVANFVEDLHDAGVARYHVSLARRIGDLKNRLASFARVKAIEIKDDKFVIETDADADGTAELLQKLINAGLPIIEFRKSAVDLEQAYIRAGVAQVD
ncbi:MAG: ABC transporter ATP-binding protein [Phycisphaerae bacterium]